MFVLSLFLYRRVEDMDGIIYLVGLVVVVWRSYPFWGYTRESVNDFDD